MTRAENVLESNIATFLSGYTGNLDNATASVKMLYPYFQSEEKFNEPGATSVDEVDNRFWNEIVQIGTPEMLDKDGNFVKVKHYFSSLDGLLEYMNRQTVGMDDNSKEDKINDILKDCPGQYGAAYRYYLSDGTKVDLKDEDEVL